MHKISCPVCGKRFIPDKSMTYSVMKRLSFAECLTTAPVMVDVIDCPLCGCQVKLAERVPKVSGNPTVMDAETEGQE